MAINQVEQQPAYPGHFIERNLSNVRESSNNKAHYFFFLLKSITSRWHIQRQTVLVKYRSIVCEWRHESKSHGAPTCFRARVSACNTFGTSSFKVFGTAPTFRPFARIFLFSGRNDAKNYAHRRIDGDQNRSCEKENAIRDDVTAEIFHLLAIRQRSPTKLLGCCTITTEPKRRRRPQLAPSCCLVLSLNV